MELGRPCVIVNALRAEACSISRRATSFLFSIQMLSLFTVVQGDKYIRSQNRSTEYDNSGTFYQKMWPGARGTRTQNKSLSSP
jgi:hypothetical protein